MLDAASHRPRPALTVAGDFALSTGRAHELCGPGRQALALALAAASAGPLLWIAPGRQAGQLCGEGIARWIDPARLLFAHPPRDIDLLWCAEEALRSGSLPLVIAELPAPPGLTPVRRLHLACESAAENTGSAPLPTMLLLTPEDGGAAGVESRWHAAPRHSRTASRWLLSRRRARNAPPAQWWLSQPAPRAALRLTPAQASAAPASPPALASPASPPAQSAQPG